MNSSEEEVIAPALGRTMPLPRARECCVPSDSSGDVERYHCDEHQLQESPSKVGEQRVPDDLPLVVTNDDATRITLIGEGTALQRTLEAASEIVAVRLEKTGEYQPEGNDLASTLTDRQHQILRLAVEHGYYEVPRHTTIEDLADETERSPSTVAAHLQKIEAVILPHAVR